MSFRDIKGQDKPIHLLQAYLSKSLLQGGYLFTGAEGVGKKLVAKTTAKAVNCLERELDSCDRCSSCLKIEHSQHPDVHIIETEESQIKIEYIRQLQREINLRAYEAKTKVFIIDNAHSLTAEASNALLKILEEPPSGSLIILISDKPGLIFKTIISRCKILKFSPLVREELKEILKKDFAFDNNTAHFLAYFSEGRLGHALKLKDTDMLREKNRIIDRFALSGKPILQNLPVQNRENARVYLNILATWIRDIYLLKTGMPHSEIINFDRKDELLKVMSRFSLLDLNELINVVSDSLLHLDQNMNVRLILYNLGVHLWKG